MTTNKHEARTGKPKRGIGHEALRNLMLQVKPSEETIEPCEPTCKCRTENSHHEGGQDG